MAANGYVLARGADANAFAAVITFAAAAFVVCSSRSPLWAMAAAAVLAVAAGRLGCCERNNQRMSRIAYVNGRYIRHAAGRRFHR